MKSVPISAKLTGGEPVEVDFDMPENLTEMVDEWGEEAVYNQARQAIVVSLQGRMRTMIKPDRKGGPADQEELQKMADEFEVGTRKPAKSKAEKVKETWAQLDPETKKALMAEMRATADAPAEKPAPRQGNGATAKQPARTAQPAAKTAAPQRTQGAPARPATAQPQGAKRPATAPTRPGPRR